MANLILWFLFVFTLFLSRVISLLFSSHSFIDDPCFQSNSFRSITLLCFCNGGWFCILLSCENNFALFHLSLLWIIRSYQKRGNPLEGTKIVFNWFNISNYFKKKCIIEQRIFFFFFFFAKLIILSSVNFSLDPIKHLRNSKCSQ